jgi:hypothetical protein
MIDKFTSIQQWDYVGGDTLSEALRNLADLIDSIPEQQEKDMIFDMSDTVPCVHVSYSEEDETYRAGICTHWRKPRKDSENDFSLDSAFEALNEFASYGIQGRLLASQEPLGYEFEEILHKNLWDLYEN